MAGLEISSVYYNSKEAKMEKHRGNHWKMIRARFVISGICYCDFLEIRCFKAGIVLLQFELIFFDLLR